MNGLLFELRQVLRTLLRSPGYAATAIGMLASGLGLTIYMFGAIDTFLLKPLPFRDGERIAHVELSDAATNRFSIEMPLHEFLDLEAVQKSLSPFAFYTTGTVNLSGDERPERYDGGLLGPDTFETIGVQPLLGRTFVRDDYKPGAAKVVVISRTLWQQRFLGDRNILGRSVRVNGHPTTIIGVMPEGYRFPIRQEVWLPLDLDLSKTPRGQSMTGEVIGRMRAGVSYASTAQEFDGLLAAIAAAHPDTASKGMRSVVKSLNAEYAGTNTPRLLLAMMCAVLFVLLIACANVANLLLARTAERARELAIHAALGAERRRLMFRLVLEGMLICAIGAAIGLLFAQQLGVATMNALNQGENGMPFWMHYELDPLSIAFAIGVAVLSALAATLVPAWRAGRVAPALVMREGGGAGKGAALGRFSRILVAGEIMLCAVLLVLAGLTVRSIHKMQTVDVGADVEHVMSGRIALFEDRYPDAAAQRAAHAALLGQLQALPGVSSAALTTSVPLTFASGTQYLEVGQSTPQGKRLPFARLVSVTASYFDTFRIPLLRGRWFSAHDDADAVPVALINKAMADRLWPGADPIGKRLDLDPQSAEDVPVEIVGLVPTVLQGKPDAHGDDALYVPLAQRPSRYLSLAIRVAGEPTAQADALRHAVQAVDPDLPVYYLRSVEQWVAIATVADRLLAKLFALFAVFGVLLAGAGVYALLSFGVSARTREIGVRRALGAQDALIVRMVLRQGMTQLVAGLAVGLLLAAAFSRVLSNVLFGVTALDPPTFIAVIVLLALMVATASYLPARRALRVQPNQALRQE